MHIFTVTSSVHMFTLIRIIAVHICTLKCSKRIPDERSKKTQFNKNMFLIDLNFTKTLIFCIFLSQYRNNRKKSVSIHVIELSFRYAKVTRKKRINDNAKFIHSHAPSLRNHLKMLLFKTEKLVIFTQKNVQLVYIRHLVIFL